MHRKRGKDLGLLELIAIALGGMIGGGIFSILGISVAMIGNLTPLAIIIGGFIAFLAAYSYVKLGLYYKDEGATYSFYKRTYAKSHLSAATIGWFVTFGYISTLALYAYTFASYVISGTDFADDIWLRKIIAIAVLSVFALINIWSVKGMGKIEDLIVYIKLIILTIISFLLMKHGTVDLQNFSQGLKSNFESAGLLNILIVSSITFVAYEGFQLVIHAVNEMKNPDKNIPRAIYSAIGLATLIYVVIALGALFAIPLENIVKDKEYALASGAQNILGNLGANLVILGAVFATSSAISGTIFGSSRLLTVISSDGYFPRFLKKRKRRIPRRAIVTISLIASGLILIGGLKLILEFGSITFLLVSLLIAIANHKIRKQTKSSSFLTVLSIVTLFSGGVLILYYEFSTEWEKMISIIFLYILLSIGAIIFAEKNRRKTKN